jgi:hypothetical protein
MSFNTDDLVNFAENVELNDLENNVLIEIAAAARANGYHNCGHNLGVMIRNLADRCDYVRRNRIYHAAGQSTGFPIYKTEYVSAGYNALIAAGFSV